MEKADVSHVYAADAFSIFDFERGQIWQNSIGDQEICSIPCRR